MIVISVEFETPGVRHIGIRVSVIVEGTEVGGTLDQTIANARANREFLEKTPASA